MTRTTIRPPRLASSLLLAGLAGCSYHPPVVPIAGPDEDVLSLAGEWAGEYWSAETGRSGSIFFRVTEAGDSATGDVLMVPGDRRMAVSEDVPWGTSQRIGITFVTVRDGGVRGLLDPYRDPVCGCRLETTFTGVMHGDAIAGTFSSRHIEGGAVQGGQWRVVRRALPESGPARP